MKVNLQKQYDPKTLLLRQARSGESVYGYDLRTRQGVFSPAVSQRYGVPETVENLPQWMVDAGFVAPESVEDWRGLFAAMERGETAGSARISMRSERGIFMRYWKSFHAATDENGEPFFALIHFHDFTAAFENERTQRSDIRGLLQAAHKVFPEILTLNLTRNTYRMIQYDSDTTLGTPQEGCIEDMIRTRLGGVVAEDRQLFADTFSVQTVQKAFLEEGRESIQLTYRRLGRDGRAHWFETTVMPQHDEVDPDVRVVVMSRSVNAQKAEEARLREQLRLQEEELRLTMTQMGKLINYYDVASSTFTMPPEDAKRRGVPPVMKNFPESFLEQIGDRLQPEAKRAIQAFYDAIRQGEPTGVCEYLNPVGENESVWMRLEFVNIFDNAGLPARAVVSAENITGSYVLAAETERLRESERLLSMVAQHSDRIVCQYDVQRGQAKKWDEETCGCCRLPRLCEISLQEILDSGDVLPESVEELREMFDNIHAGVPRGAIRMRVRTTAGDRRWFDLQYSTIFDSDGKPVTSLISHKDITEQYEHELAYLRHTRAVNESRTHIGSVEVDLQTGLIDSQGGHMAPPGVSNVGQPFADFGKRMVSMKFEEEDRQEGCRFFSDTYLLERYAAGDRELERVWRMRFRDGGFGWVQVSVALMDDPYTGHPKAFFHMTDITEEWEKQLAIQARSERDGMTGILNRATAENRVKEKLADKDKKGILLLLDLDDLKGINDTYGHAEGDRVIKYIAEALKKHFRETDVIGRIGGDEFLVYLHGAADSSEAIAGGLAALLRKLAAVSIGGDSGRRIHCSIGCAVQSNGEDFDTLYHQADVALYHVKRGSKNNFAFYTPAMEQADYNFRTQKLFHSAGARKFEVRELQYLLEAITTYYPMAMSVNLTENDYFLMSVTDGLFSPVPVCGVLEDFLAKAAEVVHPSDIHILRSKLSRDALMEAHSEGGKSVRQHFRYRAENGEYHWVEVTVIFYDDDGGSACGFALVRWARERSYELEQLWMQKLLELTVTTTFEYLCLVNVENGKYFLYGDKGNTHAVSRKGSFDDATREICQALVIPEEREAYYEHARLETILARMREQGAYSYEYNLLDGPRQASFYWFEPTHTQLLMTVQRR